MKKTLFYVRKDTLKRLLSFAANNPDERPPLKAVYFYQEEGGKFAVATNGHVLLRTRLYDVEFPEMEKKVESVNVPAVVLEKALKIMDKTKSFELNHIGISGGFVQVNDPPIRLKFESPGNFPSLGHLWDAKIEYRIGFDARYLKLLSGKVIMEITEKGGPVYIKDYDGEEEYKAVVMPLIEKDARFGCLKDLDDSDDDDCAKELRYEIELREKIESELNEIKGHSQYYWDEWHKEKAEKEKLEEKISWMNQENFELRETLKEYSRENRRLREIIAAQPKKAKKTGKRRINRTLETAEKVLREFGALTARGIVEKAKAMKLWVPESKTPANSVYSRVLEDIKRNPETTRFRIESGLISLK